MVRGVEGWIEEQRQRKALVLLPLLFFFLPSDCVFLSGCEARAYIERKMHVNPFPRTWFSFDLGKYRACDSTYQPYDYETIPPLDEALFDGSFSWLGAGTPDPSLVEKVATLKASLANVGLEMPQPFETFMCSRALRKGINSCTACEFHLSESPVPSKVGEGAYTVRFLRDQQDCLFWYLYLSPGSESCVLVSPIPFDDPGLDVSAAVVLANTWWCAPHFEHFIYRFWIENEIWFEQNEGDGEGEEADVHRVAKKRYIDHYKNSGGNNNANNNSNDNA